MRKGEVFVAVILGFACAICILVLNDAFKDDTHFLEAMVLGVLGGGLIGALSLLSIHTFGFLAESMKKKFWRRPSFSGWVSRRMASSRGNCRK